jgi:hypothetical protein
VRFWDETGVFTVRGADETVTPRLTLFAEIGAARQASAGDEPAIRSWVAESIEREVFECIALAAGLNPVVAESLVEASIAEADDVRRHRLLMTAVSALRSGAELSADLRLTLKTGLLQDASAGDREGWNSLTAAADLIDAEDGDNLGRAAEAFPPEHQRIVSGLFALKYPEVATGEHRRSMLLAVLQTERLPKLGDRIPREGQRDLRDWMVDASLSTAVTGAAHELADSEPEAILAIIPKVSVGVSQELSKLMIRHGQEAAVSEIHRESFERTIRWMEELGVGRDPYLELLEGLAGRPHGSLDRQMARRLDALADLVETLNLNDVSSTMKGGIHRGHGVDVALLAITLAGLDGGVIATQAQVVLNRMALFDDDHSPYFALFDLAETRPLDGWGAVEDVESALFMAVDLLWGGLGSANLAVNLFWNAPQTSSVVDALRDTVRRLGDKSPDHLLCAAACLTRQVGDLDPGWATSANPMLRRVVARLAPAEADGRVNPVIENLLEDPDGTVRIEAVRTVARSRVAERGELLQRVVEAGEPQFTCLHCGRITGAGTQFCECRIGGAQPAAEAAAALGHG